MSEQAPPPEWETVNLPLDKAIEKIQKLLDRAANTSSESEAAEARAKAQKWLTQYNLNVATVEAAKGGTAKREQANINGGFYAFQRALWKAVAELNFCIYWTQSYIAKDQPYSIRATVYHDTPGAYLGKGKKDMTRKRHAVVGRIVNTRATIAMATYLQGAIERALAERLSASSREENMKSFWAWSFRKGCAARLMEEARDRREKFVAAEEQKRRKAERAAKRASSGASVSTALSINTLVDQETDANQDFIHGEGWSAKQAAKRAERARLRKEAEDNYTKWAKAHPKEAQAKWSYSDKSGRIWTMGRHSTKGAAKSDNYDTSAYYAGYDAGQKIGLDPQVDTGKHTRIGRQK